MCQGVYTSDSSPSPTFLDRFTHGGDRITALRTILNSDAFAMIIYKNRNFKREKF